MRSLNSIKPLPVEKLITILLFSQPLLVLIIKGWSSGILIIGCMLCLVYLALCSKSKNNLGLTVTTEFQSIYIFILGFSSLFIATLVAGIFRGNLDSALLDSPVRFVLVIPIFYFLLKNGRNKLWMVMLCIACGLFSIALHQALSSHTNDWSSDRLSNHFADPLAFGYICLSMAFMTLGFVFSGQKRNRGWLGFMLLATVIGLTMSVLTASRTGWLAFPLVILCILYFHAEKIRPVHWLVTMTGLVLVLIIGYFSSTIIQTRIDDTRKDFTSYSFNNVAPDTSVGLRITFLRMAADMLADRPLGGYGDTQKHPPPMPEAVNKYASRLAQDFALASGFHNEIVTNGIQSGVLAMFATLAIFLAPGYIYFSAMKSDDSEKRASGLVGMIFVITIFISSLSTEVFGLKYTASYYALMSTIFCGICLSKSDNKSI